MIVAELIEVLKRLPPDMEVCEADYNSNYYPIKTVEDVPWQVFNGKLYLRVYDTSLDYDFDADLDKYLKREGK